MRMRKVNLTKDIRNNLNLGRRELGDSLGSFGDGVLG